MGGLARRATYLQQARAATPGALLVDTGGTLLGTADPVDASMDRILGRALASMKYDVLNVGAGEARAGPLAAEQLAGPGAPALVASADPGTSGSAAAGSPLALAKPYVIREAAGVRVAFVGVTSPELAPASVSPGLSAATVEALRKLLPEVRRQADIVVALADLEPNQAEALASAGLDLDVVLGRRSIASRPAAQSGRTVFASAGGHGDYVDLLTLEVDTKGKVTSFVADDSFLEGTIADDPAMLALIEQYR